MEEAREGPPFYIKPKSQYMFNVAYGEIKAVIPKNSKRYNCSDMIQAVFNGPH